MVHSGCYSIPLAEGGPSGENLALGYRTPSSAVDAWYNEVSLCTSFPGCLGKFSGGTGHFTAMIWAGAKTLACTISKANSALIACRFGTQSSISGNTPNISGYFNSMVKGLNGKTKTECSGSSSTETTPITPTVTK